MKDNITALPGVTRVDQPLLHDGYFETEQELLTDLQGILEKYNGKISNVALIGSLTLFANMISLGSLGGDEDE
tara:strand:- start:1914 stop:2132 length:219 start_codon:yes stop_codon:yes gene_type:complete